jgi:NAD+ synthase (glutamine-hydrolysing)
MVAEPKRNAAEIFSAVQRAKAVGAQVLLTPELSLCGYTCADLFGQAALLDACEAALQTLLTQTADWDGILVVGVPVRAAGRLFNCAAVLQSGEVKGIVPKRYLPNVREYYEKRWFASGNAVDLRSIDFLGKQVPFGSIVFSCGADLLFAAELCEDLWVPSPPSEALALAGADLILNLSASDEEVSKNAYRRSLVAQQSGRLRCGYAYASAGVGESSTDLVFSGAAFIAENGNILTEGRRFAQSGSDCYAVLDIELLRAERRFGSYYDCAESYFRTNREPQGVPCAALPQLQEEHMTRRYAPQPFVPADLSLRAARCGDILDIQVAGLCKRLTHVGLDKMIIGLSGGLDSTLALLVAHRAAETLGWESDRILGITMPGFGTTSRTRDSVEQLAKALDIQLWEIDIRPACEQHMADIGHDPDAHDITYENTQARERTQILMDLANQEGALLLGTGDLSELALGWCTYNADHMSMYGVNSGVPKTLVRHIVEFVAEEDSVFPSFSPDDLRFIPTEKKPTRLQSALRQVLATPISPELLPPDENGEIAQKTESVLGSYDVHDFYLYYFFRYGFSPEKLLFIAERAFGGEAEPAQLKEWLELFLKRFFSQQFKRSCLPDGPKVGSVALSPRGDWRMPSDAAVGAWLRRLDA